MIGQDQLKQELIDGVAERVHARLDAQRAPSAERFVRQLYAHVAPADLLDDTPANLFGAAVSLLTFATDRKPGTARVRVFNPDAEEHGWASPHTIVEIVTDDMPFLVDSVTSHLVKSNQEVQLVVHPLLKIERNDAGHLVDVCSDANGHESVVAESLMHVQVAAVPSSELDGVRDGLARVLDDVRAAVEDWPKMMAQGRAAVAELRERASDVDPDLAESTEFLEWLADDNFTFLGYREYRFEADRARVVSDSGLGLLRDELSHVFAGLITGGHLPAELTGPETVRVMKANRRSTVHRSVLMDTIGVKVFDEHGMALGERLFIGLFTSAAYGRQPREVPLLRQKVQRVLDGAGFPEGSHDHNVLHHILATYPRDELFQISVQDLQPIAIGILHLQERSRTALFARLDPFGRFASCLVYVPRDRYDTALRLRFQEILEDAFEGDIQAFYTRVIDAPLARLHFIVGTTPGAVPPIDVEAIEARLVEAGRSWTDGLRDALIEMHGEERGLQLFRRFARAFPSSYRDTFSPETAARDIERIDDALEDTDLSMSLYHPVEAAADEVRFKIYACGEPAPISRVLPMLEHMGFEVLGEAPFHLRLRKAGGLCIRDFTMRTPDSSPVDVAHSRERFHDAFRRVWSGELESDGFNQLVLRAGLCAREVTVLRAYCKFLRQARIAFSQEYMEQTLAGNPGIASLLVQLFHTRFDPAFEGDREEAATGIVSQVEAALEFVSNLDEDRIIRRFLGVIEATLRTNFYQRETDGSPRDRLALKLASREIANLPLPHPLREIFVYSPRVEAVHLRGGFVARGGIRWSDRREDFRTEVLGLMKAQMVKNTVIVPVGSKGGFVVKRPPVDRDALWAEVVACYSTMMRGLLDITDNLVGDEVVPPEDTVRRDDDDPYLVVAADKGTATFSDTANGISTELGFWLDDAYASGGSAGYDHKKMGITARGGWESVKRHFREMGKDTQTQDFTVVGVGDMGGDVFGNGMLLSRHIRLVAAFNHLHVFIDPSPDADTSFAERQRLFDLPRSSWDDYDRTLISEGGGVFPRSAKSIKLTPQLQKLLGLTSDRATPNEVINEILKADVELLWLGGIGTYVRHAEETDAQVGDHANNALRITATELRANVVGEGANLGLTQRARIQFARRGGRINTDAIDNSAGVDCSDHEVNIKILLGDAERSGDLTRKQRNRLLVEMTDEVAELVLRDNYLQTQCISVTQRLGGRLLDRMGRYMRALEKSGRLNRRVEFLPDDEALAERATERTGLTRPEIAVLMAYAKIELFDELVRSNLPDETCMDDALVSYFPTPLRERFRDRMASHRLRREIVATMLTNHIVNRVGVTFVREVRERTGLGTDDVARAFLIARDICNMRGFWRRIEALDNEVPAAAQGVLFAECGRAMNAATVWFLRREKRPLDVTATVTRYAEGIAALADRLDSLTDNEQRRMLKQRRHSLVEAGCPHELAERVARLSLLTTACDVIRIDATSEHDLETVARTYFAVGTRFGFNWLRIAAARLPSDTAWDKLAVSALVDDLSFQQAELTSSVLAVMKPEGAPSAALRAWSSGRRPLIVRSKQLLTELRSVPNVTLSMLAVASRQLRSLQD